MDSELSNEMIMEIISRSSLKTLDIMRCASNELNALTYESYLLDLYKKRNEIISGFLIQNVKSGWLYIQEFAPSPESRSLDLGFLPYNARILATSEQGIIVFQNRDYADFSFKDLYHVCKPTTKQVLALPNPEGRYTPRKFAIVVMSLKSLHYKIIRFCDHHVLKRWGEFYTTYRCDIFDSTTWEWRSLNQVNLPYGVFLTNPQPITKSGSIYMLLTNNDILKFDAYSERWKVFSSPIPYDQFDTSMPLMELVKYGGRLGLACKLPNSNGRWEIWVLTMGQMWEKIYVCKKKEGVAAEREWESLMALYDSDTSVMANRDTILFYRFKQEGDTMISKVVLNDIPYQIFTFRSDFEPIDLV
ncbi:hypothetical protein L1987_29318 [Smallanthus sonchifolius]|uniref:Uncharacterized protein n=1 Tax=Smallanthus sonchifolius TaxID=185202 RepID=A0ACB9HZQ1_9ASTR|nr:hypothetical protein L1987_29318 [Smallanthus sonchifolius]